MEIWSFRPMNNNLKNEDLFMRAVKPCRVDEGGL